MLCDVPLPLSHAVYITGVGTAMSYHTLYTMTVLSYHYYDLSEQSDVCLKRVLFHLFVTSRRIQMEQNKKKMYASYRYFDTL